MPDLDTIAHQANLELDAAAASAVRRPLGLDPKRSALRPRRGWQVAVIAATAAVIGGAILIGTRDGSSTESQGSAPHAVPGSPAPIRLILDPSTPGLGLTSASDFQREAWASADVGFDPGFVARYYATDSPTPELEPWVNLSGPMTGSPVAQRADSPPTPVAGVDAVTFRLHDRPYAEVTLGGRRYLITGAQLSDSEISDLATGVRLSPDGHGAVLDSAVLPPGLAEAGVSSILPVPIGRLDRVISGGTIEWSLGAPSSAGSPTVQVTTVNADGADLRLLRLGMPSPSEVTVRGRVGLSFVVAGSGSRVVWTESGQVYDVSVSAASPIGATEIAEQLRPAMADEWSVLIAESAALRAVADENPAPTEGAPANTDVPALGTPPADRIDGLIDLDDSRGSAATRP